MAEFKRTTLGACGLASPIWFSLARTRSLAEFCWDVPRQTYNFVDLCTVLESAVRVEPSPVPPRSPPCSVLRLCDSGTGSGRPLVADGMLRRRWV